MIIPAVDEEGAIGGVVEGFRATGLLDEIVVVDNGSRDRTVEVARAAGATVIHEPARGYGSACLGGLAYLRGRPGGPPRAVVFADGDGANDPRDLAALLAPIEACRAELVLGSRVRRARASSLTVPQRFGNALACAMLKGLYGVEYGDLGPFRAITWRALELIDMRDRDFGWTVEMQVKVAKQALRFEEIDVENHERVAGESKISGTVRGVVFAGTKIISTIVRHR